MGLMISPPTISASRLSPLTLSFLASAFFAPFSLISIPPSLALSPLLTPPASNHLISHHRRSQIVDLSFTKSILVSKSQIRAP
uniref:Uncharacterized protein n=1 Tax=Fagus sylvatica TaxID=28930 RepID=A0A2N9GHR9_FAGSY